MIESIHEIIRTAENNYLNNTIKIGKYVNWSHHDTIEKIDAYLNSIHTSGDLDSLGREKPFFNIVTAASNIWYRATDIDRKDIKFVPETQSSVVLAFVANVMLQNWMDKNRFGQFLNSWGRSMARYGSAISKFVVQGNKLIPMVVSWNKFIPDPISFDSIPRIEKLYLTPAQLKKNKLYDQDVVESLVTAASTRKTLDGTSTDHQDNFIEVYEVHGELDTRLLDQKPDLNLPDQDIKYRQQMHTVSFVKTSTGEASTFDDFTLYKGKEANDPYQKDDLLEEDGRTLAIGAVEHLFNAQWMKNHAVKNMKDTLDLASKLIFQTADPRYVGRNVLNTIETGDIFTHQVNMPLTRLANDKPDITAMQNFGTMWEQLGQEITATPDAFRGKTPVSGTPLGTTELLTRQANSLFEIMTENKGLAIEDMMVKYVVPHIRKQLNNLDEVVAILDDAGIQEIDSIYIPKEAVKRYNKRSVEQVLNREPVDVFDKQGEEQLITDSLKPLGNKRFFSPDELGKKMWDEIMSDFQWSNIRVEVVNENSDKQAVLQTLATLYSQTIQTDPIKANIILARIMSETGVFSPMEFASSRSAPPVEAQDRLSENLPVK